MDISVERDFLDLSGNAMDQRIRAFKELWATNRQGHAMPLTAALDETALAAFRDMLIVIDAVGSPPRLVYRYLAPDLWLAPPGRDLVGRNVLACHGKSMTASSLRAFTTVLDTRRPVRLFGQAMIGQGARVSFEALSVPLRDESGRIATIMMVTTAHAVEAAVVGA